MNIVNGKAEHGIYFMHMRLNIQMIQMKMINYWQDYFMKIYL